jgi:LacI family transcriptional regulator
MKRLTSRDVAKLAGVSQSTVSFVLNNSKKVTISDETRERVLSAAKQLNYVPNVFAKGLKTNVSKLIGLMVPNITNPFYPLLIQSIEEYAATNGYNILLCNTHRKIENERFYLNLLAQKSVDGIIYLFAPSFPEELKELSNSLPIVVIGDRDDNKDLDTISLDSFKSGQFMIRHLMELGHERIAFISGSFTSTSLSKRKRLEGIIHEMKKHKLDKFLIIKEDANEREIYDSTYEIEVGTSLALELLKNNKVTAIVGANDMTAFGAMTAIQKLGLKIPDDISICGFDNIFLSKMVIPNLTTIDNYIPQRGRLAMDILLDKLSSSHNDMPQVCKVEYEPLLVVRESTGPAKKNT